MSPPRLYDISRPLAPDTAPWPGDEPVRIARTLAIEAGANVNLGALTTSLHNATHADAPFHVTDTGGTIEQVALDRYLGPARLVEAPEDGPLGAAWARRVLEEGAVERLLVRTGSWERSGGAFPADFPVPSPEAARVLAQGGVRLFGTDAPSVDPVDSATLDAHHALIGAGVAILENLDLTDVPVGRYELIALPLRIAGGDASPVRAVLREMP
jgi:arylformamidase